MTQAIAQVTKTAGVPRHATGLAGLLIRAARIFGARRDPVIRPDALSRHTLRDIGLAEDLRANHLLNDGWLRR